MEGMMNADALLAYDTFTYMTPLVISRSACDYPWFLEIVPTGL
jgi:hypothetical protein